MDRNSFVRIAKLAEQAEHFDEMACYMNDVARQPQKLTVEECDLLSKAYKGVIDSRRASWRVSMDYEYKMKIENELLDICNEILSIIEESLLPKSTSWEDMAFCYKMKGDYHQYLCEFQRGDTRKTSASAALDAYQSATEIASTGLSPTHPIRLRLANNFSVFYYDILNNPDRAYYIGKQAFDDASASAKSKSGTMRMIEESRSRKGMQLLEKNIKIWKSKSGQAADNVQKKTFVQKFYKKSASAIKLGSGAESSQVRRTGTGPL